MLYSEKRFVFSSRSELEHLENHTFFDGMKIKLAVTHNWLAKGVVNKKTLSLFFENQQEMHRYDNLEVIVIGKMVVPLGWYPG